MQLQKKLFLISILFIFSTIMIAKGDGHKKKTSSDHSTKSDDCADVHWTYRGKEAPKHWADLCPTFSECDGKAQSPIDISKAVHDSKLVPIQFDYYPTTTNIVNNGHTIQFNVKKGSTISINHKDYELLQFHFHALSEHTIGGKHYPLEVHFVHKYNDEELAVVGVMLTEGRENDLLTKYLKKFPKEAHTSFRSGSKFEIADLLPNNRSYFHYGGSLTTPPCSEVVSWYVLRTAITASKKQIKQLSKMLYHNYRPTNPLNGRVISFYE